MRIDVTNAEPEMIARMADLSGLRVMEVGGGEGRMTAMLADVAERVVSIDTDAESVAKARSAVRSPNVEFSVADICTMEPRPSTVDAVVLALSL
jgi:protein-L-isoaspartate O-methyltransferase